MNRGERARAVAWAAEQWRKNVVVHRIAAALRVPDSTVYSWARRGGWPPRRAGRRGYEE